MKQNPNPKGAPRKQLAKLEEDLAFSQDELKKVKAALKLSQEDLMKASQALELSEAARQCSDFSRWLHKIIFY